MDIVDRLNGNAPSIPAMRDGAEEIMRLRREREVLRYEREVARAHRDRLADILARIHACIAPPEITDADGKRWRYNGPEMSGMLQMVSDRIRAIPDELTRAATETPERVNGLEPGACESCGGTGRRRFPGHPSARECGKCGGSGMGPLNKTRTEP